MNDHAWYTARSFGGYLLWRLSTQLNAPGWYILTVPGHFITIQYEESD
jgi:hypothetical protein